MGKEEPLTLYDNIREGGQRVGELQPATRMKKGWRQVFIEKNAGERAWRIAFSPKGG